MDRPTPRVNSSLLEKYGQPNSSSGDPIRITGKVERLDGNSAVIEASDQGHVTVKLSPEANFSEAYVEVIGKVAQDLTVQELTSVNMGENLDMSLVEQAVNLTQAYPGIFGME
ncbi:replication factor A3, partial [Phenoliferia sp. Uapishka_3]